MKNTIEKISFYWMKCVLGIFTFVFPSIKNTSVNNNYNIYFKNGVTPEAYKKFMEYINESDPSTYKLFLFIPTVLTVMLFFIAIYYLALV
jgi:hypothetical protein